MLKELPVDTLKVDIGFMKRGDKAARGARIMEGVVDVARDLGLDVVVEGVETKEDRIFVTQMGAELIQGYFYAKPMPSDDFVELCAKNFLEGK
jgi:EAL domain-containing protein (putative c-di-GMP-specific phosphodiesterase class I)